MKTGGNDGKSEPRKVELDDLLERGERRNEGYIPLSGKA